jgi:ParB-like chromosome segregation protein Spo0J
MNEKRIGPHLIPIADLEPHPLNANVMTDDLREKLRAHIKESGRYPFLVVRPYKGKYQVLDGHHRIAILKELGHTEARCDVWDVSDREAKVLLATLNRLEGQDQPIRRAQLIHELLAEMSVEDLGGLLPETEKQLEELHSLLEFPADEIAAQLQAEAEEAEKVLPRVMSFVVSPEQEEVIERAVETASDGTPGRDRRARGLTNLAKQFLGGEGQ